MKPLFLLLISFFINLSITGQDSKIHIGVLKFKILNKTETFFSSNNINQYKNALSSSEIYIIERLLEDKRVEIIERSKLNLIKSELELQKSENFMDGYVVSQGGHIGADYLIYGVFNPDNKDLGISMFSVKKNNVINKKVIPLKSNFWGKMDYKENIQNAISKIMNEEFPVLIPLIEILKGGSSKAKEVLVAGGTKNGFHDYDKVSFYIDDVKIVGTDTLRRQKTIGTGKILEVENENFSRVQIKKGKKEIKKFFDSGVKINCKLK